MSKKTGTLIKNARTKAGLTQAQLAKKVDGCTAADIGKAERGEKDLTQEQLKAILVMRCLTLLLSMVRQRVLSPATS